MAEAFGSRPSELLGVCDPWAAFCLDEALFVRHRLALSDDGEAGPRFRAGGFSPPSATDLRKIPWGGEGPDPLEELWESS
ncbi:MAG TPA: hypothetical protein VJK66_02515 [Gaiellaceae bacterium]|nr:hypothetical protein [Gaiellaceae bacterium]